MTDMISREAVVAALTQSAERHHTLARQADEAGHDTSADMDREAAEALLAAVSTVRALPAEQPVTAHTYTPSMNPNDQGECVICGGSPQSVLKLGPWNPVTSPSMTDMMVDPASLDAFMEANPLPAVQPTVQAQIDAAVKAERERCAQVAEGRLGVSDALRKASFLTKGMEELVACAEEEARIIAAAIRKGEQP